MAINRADLLKEILPGLNKLFDDVYSDLMPYHRIEMPKRGRYQVWHGHRLMADRIKHRKEAIAVMKLLMENEDG